MFPVLQENAKSSLSLFKTVWLIKWKRKEDGSKRKPLLWEKESPLFMK